MSNKIPDVSNVFKQLDAGLCLVARVKQVSPPSAGHFVHSTPNVAELHLDGGVYQIVITQKDPPEEPEKAGG